MTHTSDRPTVEAFAAVLFDMDGTLVDSEHEYQDLDGVTATGATVAGLEGGAGGAADVGVHDLPDLLPRPASRRTTP
jgi:FMN phosphatase YigB (HAD superfamily)